MAPNNDRIRTCQSKPKPGASRPHLPLPDACGGSGSTNKERWEKVLLGYEETPDFPAQLTGEVKLPRDGAV